MNLYMAMSGEEKEIGVNGMGISFPTKTPRRPWNHICISHEQSYKGENMVEMS